MEGVREAVGIPVRVMVRPHARSFRYDKADVETMLRDIRHIAAIGGLSVVMGMLRRDRTVDEEQLKQLLQAADGMEVTFHRAFDEAEDQLEALEILSRYPQVTDILTSGGQRTAPEGAERIAVLERLSSAKSVSILAGSGLTASGLREFLGETAVERVHFGSAVREEGDPLRPIDPGRLQEVRSILDLWGK